MPYVQQGGYGMSTIIERIAAAEADADTIRRNAVDSARAAVADAEDAAAISIRVAKEEIKTELALASNMAERDGKNQADSLIQDRKKAVQQEMAVAAKNINKAVNLIIERITQ